MNTKKMALLLATFGVLLLVSCGDPAALDRAGAYATRQASDMSVVVTATANANDQRATATAQALTLNARATQIANTTTAKMWGSRAWHLLAPVTMAFLVAGLGAIVLLRTYQSSGDTREAFRVYALERAQLAARTIAFDKHTLTLPAVITDNAIHLLDTGMVIKIDEAREVDQQTAAISGHVRAMNIGAAAIKDVSRRTEETGMADSVSMLAGSTPVILRPIEPSESRRHGEKGDVIEKTRADGSGV